MALFLINPYFHQLRSISLFWFARVQNCELILKRYCVINEAELLDLGYLRGAIEVQARQNNEAVSLAKEKEQQRLELSKKVRQEIEQYLL